MYSVLAGNNFLHIPVSQDESKRLVSGKAVYEVGKNGTMDMTIPVTNSEYESLQERKTVVRLIRRKNGVEKCIYQGLYMSESDGLDFEKEIKTDGFMVVLNDTNIRPYHRTTNPKNEFIALINEHNSRTDTFKKLQMGNITVTGNDRYRSQDGYTSTKEAIDSLVAEYGGYVQIRVEGNRISGFSTYIDWLAKLNDVSEQKIRYGKNIIDITRHINTDNLVTRIIPLGNTQDGIPTTIKSVNNGVDYLEDTDAIQRYGIIEKIVTFDLESPTEIKKAGQEYLDTNKGAKLSIELTAVDLAEAGYDTDNLEIGNWVHCIASRYRINTWMQIQKYELNFMNIAQSKITLGATLDTFTQKQNDVPIKALMQGLKTAQGTASGAAAQASGAAAQASGAVTQAQSAGKKADEAVQEVMKVKDSMIKIGDVYPVGSVYTSNTNVNPGEMFGGTWQSVTIIQGYYSWVRV